MPRQTETHDWVKARRESVTLGDSVDSGVGSFGCDSVGSGCTSMTGANSSSNSCLDLRLYPWNPRLLHCSISSFRVGIVAYL
jgi:hypothetical protein